MFHKVSLVVVLAFIYACEQGDSSELVTETLETTNDQNWPPVTYLQTFQSYQKQNEFHYQKRTRYEHDAYDW